MNVAVRDRRDVLGPVLPVQGRAHLLHDPAEHRLLPIRGQQRQLTLDPPGHPIRAGTRRPGPGLAPIGRRARQRIVLLLRLLEGHLLDDDVLRPLAVELHRIDRRVQTLVVRAQGLEDLPHDLEALVIVQRALRRHARRHGHGQDDVTEILALRAAHHTAHRLNDVHLRLARRQEEHRVQRGHVHALAQAARVRQDAAHRDLVRARALGQPIHLARTHRRVHRAVHVAALDLQIIRRVVVAEVAQAKGAVHQVRELIRHRL